MKNYLLFALSLLIAGTLACRMPWEQYLGEPETTLTEITEVSVEPSSGSGSFLLSVSYESWWTAGHPPGSINCTYVTPDGATMWIGQIPVALKHQDKSKVEIASAALPFIVRKINGVVKPGIYVAGCTNDRGSGLKTTQFKVIEENTPTPTLTLQPAERPTTTPTPTVTATTQAANRERKGRIIFDYTQAQSSRPGSGGELDIVTKWCPTDVTVASNGAISGTCQFSGTTTHLQQATVSTQVNGTVDAAGNVIFTYAVAERGPNAWSGSQGQPSTSVWSTEAVWQISYTGKGSFTNATQAAGPADFNYSCNSGADNLVWCWKATTETFSGTIPWRFEAGQ